MGGYFSAAEPRFPTAAARPGGDAAEQITGKELSFNSLNETDAAVELIAEFTDGPACAIIKHANPCGVACAKSLADAYAKALACDTESAFGGIVAVNQRLDAATEEEIGKLFCEVVIAPGADDDALKALAEKKNLRVLLTGAMPDPAAAGMTLRSLSGGFLLQGRDSTVTDGEPKVVTKRKPTEAELVDLRFAYTVAKHVKSNAIVYAKDQATVGVGARQMSRVNPARISAWTA